MDLKGEQMTAHKFVIPIVTFLFFGFGVAAVSAQAWHKVGSTLVDSYVDHTTLHVKDWKDGFRHIRLGVEHAPVDVTRVVITYGSGITEEIIVHILIHPGEHTYEKELHLHERSVRKIELLYDPHSLDTYGGNKAIVTLYAR